jgi:hypothetical protein
MAGQKAGWSGSLLVDQMEGLKAGLLAGWLGSLLVDSMAAWTAVQWEYYWVAWKAGQMAAWWERLSVGSKEARKAAQLDS